MHLRQGSLYFKSLSKGGRVIIDYILTKRLKELRTEKQLKQQEVADYLCCTQPSYSHYEVGEREMPIDYIIALSEFYNVSVDYLFGLTDNRSRL